MKKSQAILSRAGCVRVAAELNLIPYRITVPVPRFKYVIVPGAAESQSRFGPPGSDPGTPTPGFGPGPVLRWRRGRTGWGWPRAGAVPGACRGPGPVHTFSGWAGAVLGAVFCLKIERK